MWVGGVQRVAREARPARLLLCDLGDLRV